MHRLPAAPVALALLLLAVGVAPGLAPDAASAPPGGATVVRRVAGDVQLVAHAPPGGRVLVSELRDEAPLYIPGMEVLVVAGGCGSNLGPTFPYGALLLPERVLASAPGEWPLAHGGGLLAAGGVTMAGCAGLPEGTTLHLEVRERGPPHRAGYVQYAVEPWGADGWRPNELFLLVFNRVYAGVAIVGMPPWGDADLSLRHVDAAGTELRTLQRATQAMTMPGADDAAGVILDVQKADDETEEAGSWTGVVWAQANGPKAHFAHFQDWAGNLDITTCSEASGLVMVTGMAYNTTYAVRHPGTPCSTLDLAPDEPFARFEGLHRVLYEGLVDGVPTWR